MKAIVIAAAVLMLSAVLGDGVRAGSPARRSDGRYVLRTRIYVHREKGQEARSILLRPDGTLLYGRGGRDGIRHHSVGGMYRIEGQTIALFDYNGHRSLGEGHQTYLRFSATAIGDTRSSDDLYRRLR
jgi:hypothetical protein